MLLFYRDHESNSRRSAFLGFNQPIWLVLSSNTANLNLASMCVEVMPVIDVDLFCGSIVVGYISKHTLLALDFFS